MIDPILGFSKLTKQEKINWIAEHYTEDPSKTKKLLIRYWNTEEEVQKLHDEFIENTISNYYLPFGIAPNFLINNNLYAIPMVIEESSVVAAASKSAKFWLDRGGFKTEVIGTEKIGQVHFTFNGDFGKLKKFFATVYPKLLEDTQALSQNMQKRGGGINTIELRNKTTSLSDYYQLHCSFETMDAMGANFINSCLEQFAHTFKREALKFELFDPEERQIEIVMSILSNYVPNCVVKAGVQCSVEEMNIDPSMAPQDFVNKFIRAVKIANIEPHRAVTHNKGIMNGVDAVILATGNDFRAVEAGVHAYAAKDGQYKSLTHASIENGMFKFWIEIPLALGTVGGLTNLHPLVGLALEILQKPTSRELMQIVAVAGLAQNFAALSSLVTTGIQEGHMKMHLLNILNQLGATAEEKSSIVAHFRTNNVSHSAVVAAIEKLRSSE